MVITSGLDRHMILAVIDEATKELERVQQLASELRTFIAAGRRLLGQDDSVDMPSNGSMREQVHVNEIETTNGHETTQEHTIGGWARRYLAEVGQPMRVSEIAKGLVERQWMAVPPTIEAIRTAMGRRREEFERVGFGVYALKEWPMAMKRQTQRASRLVAPRKRRTVQQGLLPQLIHAVLLKERHSLTVQEILESIEATGQRINRASAVRALYRCAKKGQWFDLVNPGIFGLLEWRNQPAHQTTPAMIDKTQRFEAHGTEEPQQRELSEAESTLSYQSA